MIKKFLQTLVLSSHLICGIAFAGSAGLVINIKSPPLPETTNLTDAAGFYNFTGFGEADCRFMGENQNLWGFLFVAQDTKNPAVFHDETVIDNVYRQPLLKGSIVTIGSPGNLVQSNGNKWFVKLKFEVVDVTPDKIVMVFDSQNNPQRLSPVAAFASGGNAGGRALVDYAKLFIKCR